MMNSRWFTGVQKRHFLPEAQHNLTVLLLVLCIYMVPPERAPFPKNFTSLIPNILQDKSNANNTVSSMR